MQKRNTYFEQAPLGMVKRIEEEQTKPQQAPDPRSKDTGVKQQILPHVSKGSKHMLIDGESGRVTTSANEGPRP